MSYIWAYLSVAALTLACLLLIFIILLQRGRGGGLAGAFGGAGGQSALGTKAGDVFTKITVGLAVFWVFLACLSIYALRASSEGRLSLGEGGSQSAAAATVGSDESSTTDEGQNAASDTTDSGSNGADSDPGSDTTQE